MAILDDIPSPITTPHLFAHIYATHAQKIIDEYIATDQKDKISRAKIEFDIVRVMNEDSDLPLKYKMSCTSMILHTDTFEPFWGDQKLLYSLSTKSLKRLKPNYRLIDQLPCPTDEDSTALAPLQSLTDKQGNSRNQPTTAKNKGKGGRGRAAPPKANGKAPRKVTAALANRKRGTVAQKAPKTAEAAADNGVSKPNANVNANGTVSTTTTALATTALRTRRPVGKTAREAYMEHIAKGDDMHVRGPTSDEEESTADEEDSDSE